MFKRSQAALEFLTTYAWAFLVIIIMVGALAYFGVLSPSKLLPDRCNFGSEITCNKDLMVVQSVKGVVGDLAAEKTDNTLSMRLESNVGTQITIKEATIITDITNAGTCTAFIQKDSCTVHPCEVDPTLGADGAIGGTGANADVLVLLNSDETITFIAECASGDQLVKKEKIKFSLEIDYFSTAAGSAYTKKVFGEVFTTIQ